MSFDVSSLVVKKMLIPVQGLAKAPTLADSMKIGGSAGVTVAKSFKV